MRLVKGNVHTITSIMAKWSEAPLYQRREDKKDCLLNLEVGGHVQSDLMELSGKECVLILAVILELVLNW